MDTASFTLNRWTQYSTETESCRDRFSFFSLGHFAKWPNPKPQLNIKAESVSLCDRVSPPVRWKLCLPSVSVASTCTEQGGEPQRCPNRQVRQCKQRPTNRFHHLPNRADAALYSKLGVFYSVSPAVNEASLWQKSLIGRCCCWICPPAEIIN